MATVSVSTLRTRVAARVTALSGWTQSVALFDMFGADPASIAHKAFAVGVPETSDTHNYRSIPTEGARAKSTVVIRFSYRVPPKDQVTGYGDCLDAEATVLNQMMAMDSSWPSDIKVSWERTSRRAVPSGEWLIVEMTFSILHLLALA